MSLRNRLICCVFCFGLFSVGFAAFDQIVIEDATPDELCAIQGDTVILKSAKDSTYGISKTTQRLYLLLSDGTVLEKKSKLMWQRCPFGQRFSGGICVGEALAMPWENAKIAAEDDTFAGYRDWRMPYIDELESIADYCASPYINNTVFPDTVPSFYWSATNDPGYVDDYTAWYVHFGYGISSMFDKTRNGYVLLVRDSKE